MAKYNVHISSTTNLISDSRFFFGTGFMGEGFNTRDELVALMRKYATFTKNGESYWREEIKLSFELGESVEAFKAEGNRQCKENGNVDLSTIVSSCKKDPYQNMFIVYRPSGWVDKNSNEFKFILVKDKETTPKFMKLSEILRELGMDI